MKRILGIIIELNPPHNGHKYFIEEAKKIVNPDITIAVMTTNFSMRGDIMILDKFSRIESALELGVDIIIELPFLKGCTSADYFGYNSVALLSLLNITDLAFGAELANISDLEKLVHITSDEKFDTLLKENLDKGLSYGGACNKALSILTNDNDLITNYSLPNNTLAIQYIKTIKKITNKTINLHPIKRINNNYYDTLPTSSIASATSIREMIMNNQNVDRYICNKHISNYIDLKKAYENLFMLYQNSFINFNLLDNNFLYKNLIGMNEGIENRLYSMLSKASGYEKYLELTSTKRYPINRLKRLIVHVVMETSKDDSLLIDISTCLIRILGFNSNGEKYIKGLNKEIKERIITTIKGVSDKDYLKELKATKLYGILTSNYDLYLNEYKIPIRRKSNE